MRLQLKYKIRVGLFALCILQGSNLLAAISTLTIDPAVRFQEIDGFGSCISGNDPTQPWWQRTYLDELGASMLRVDLVPSFRSPWSDYGYYSPWFRGKGVAPYAFNFEVDSSNKPRYYVGSAEKEFANQGGQLYYNGPEGNRARTYKDAADYGKLYGNLHAPIAVMGPNIDENITRCFELDNSNINGVKAVVAAAKTRDASLHQFKLIGSIWSPAPWLKLSSGNSVGPDYGFWPAGAAGTPYPYIAMNGNFVGGRLDVSERQIPEFDDSKLPGDPNGPNATAARGPTSALIQYARCTAAYLRAFQNEIGTRFYAISIQNELNFETFYNSCFYRTAQEYLLAVKYVRNELDKYEDLRDIKIEGPEDLLSDSTYSLWAYGSIDKNLKILNAVENDIEGARNLSIYSIHGYASDGVSASGADPVAWTRWANGWNKSPAAGLPEVVNGFTNYGKKSWMTETSGEKVDWLFPTAGFPNNGAFSIALKIQQALSVGQQSAWLYWQTTDGKGVSDGTLTDSVLQERSPKLIAAKHFFKSIRPGSRRISATFDQPANLLPSAFLNEKERRLTVVVLNTSSTSIDVGIPMPSGYRIDGAHISNADQKWQNVPFNNSIANLSMPAYSVVTIEALQDLPKISIHPSSITTTLMPVSLSVVASGTSLRYQWYLNGAELPGSIGSSVSASVPGFYNVRVSNDVGYVTSRSAEVRQEQSNSSRLSNMSVRGTSGHQGESLIAGFVVSGGTRDILIRTAGPALDQFHISDYMQDPMVTIHGKQGEQDVVLGSNGNWGANSDVLLPLFSSLGAFTWTDTASRDAAILVKSEGPQTAVVSNEANDNEGVVLVEGYDAKSGGDGTLVNLSTRNYVGKSSGVLIVGFVIEGNSPVPVLVRAIGPTLGTAFNLKGVLSDPTLVLYRTNLKGENEIVASNDDWRDEPGAGDAFLKAGAFSLPADSLDAAIIMSLPPGQYTGVTTGFADATGVALLEVYRIPDSI